MIHIRVLEAAPVGEALEFNTLLQEAARSVVAHADLDVETELTIVVSGDAHLQELNREYMGVDAPTDVLSFSVREQDPDTGALYLGDIVISYQQAERQARQNGYATQDELQLLVVHGCLHLLGHDHAREEDRRSMWQLQDQILKELGSPIRSPQY